MCIVAPLSLSFSTGNARAARFSPLGHGFKLPAASSGYTPHTVVPGLPHEVHVRSCCHALALLASAMHASLVHADVKRHAAASGVTP